MFEGNKKSQSDRRIVSDIRPTSGKKPEPIIHVRQKTKVEKQPEPERDDFLKPKKQQRTFSRLRSAPLLIFTAVVLFFVAYVYWTATLTLAITRKISNFDLGSGVKMTLEAEEINITHSKRGEGESRNTETFQGKASGTIIVYNTYNAQPQVLVERTRFQASNGLLYRSKTRVTVPGMKGIAPGTVEVSIEAVEVGEKYNVGLTDFSIPGFAGSPKAQKFYGRSKTEMKGGSSGTGKVVGKSEAKELLDRLEEDMQSELRESFQQQLPEGYLSFPAKYEYATSLRITDPPEGSPGERFFGEVRGTARTLVIDKKLLSKRLAEVLFKDQYREGAYILADDSPIDYKNITFDYDKKKITLTAENRATYEWMIDLSELRDRVLKAKNHSALDEIFNSYSGISRVEKTFTPGFFRRIPRTESRLLVNVRE